MEEGVLAGKRVKRTEGDTYFKCDGLSNDDACAIAHYLQHLEQSARDPILQRLFESTTPLNMFKIMVSLRRLQAATARDVRVKLLVGLPIVASKYGVMR